MDCNNTVISVLKNLNLKYITYIENNNFLSVYAVNGTVDTEKYCQIVKLMPVNLTGKLFRSISEKELRFSVRPSQPFSK